MKRQVQLDSFFSKRKKVEICDSADDDKNICAPSTSSCVGAGSVSEFNNDCAKGGDCGGGESVMVSVECSEEPLNDIGKIAKVMFSPLHKEHTNLNHLRQIVLFDLDTPDETTFFPTKLEHKKNLKFQLTWMNKYSWLAYSKSLDGAYCKYCVAFCSEAVGNGSHEKIGALVASPYNKWRAALEKFKAHSETHYHKKCSAAAEHFLNVKKLSVDSVASQLNKERQKQVAENREALQAIIETVIFCGEHELPLRGHEHENENYGPVRLEKPKTKDGKFRALLRFRANSGDETLKRHLINSPRNATYVSAPVQNEILDVCAEIIQKRVVEQVNDAGAFSIIADETLDVSGTEQLSLCVRFVDSTNNVHEDFLAFSPVTDMTAEGVTTVILDQCKKLGLNLNNIVGQGYDGVSTMSGQFTGVHARIKQKYPKALYVHCASHRLNLVLSSALNGSNVRNCLGTVSEICNLFRNNSQANDLLKTNITNYVPQSKKTRLLSVCETRFVERHDCVNVFIELFEAIVPSLHELTETNRTISARASTLVAAVGKSDFVVSLFTCENLFSYTLPLSKFLQSPDVDLSSAYRYASTIIARLQKVRDEANEEFHKLFKSASNMYKLLFDDELKVPRVVNRQTTRENHPYTNAEEYFRRSIFIPALDDLLTNLKNRFEDGKSIVCSLQLLLPANASPEHVDDIENLSSYFEEGTSVSVVKSEYLLWCQKWESEELKSKKKYPSISECMDNCDKSFFPNIYSLLKILATLPVSTCSAERSFSTLKRVKNYLRNKMGNDRLTALALLTAHYGNISVSPKEVIDIMASKSRRIKLL